MIQLFNAVAEFQATAQKQLIIDEHDKKVNKTKIIKAVGTDKKTGAVGFNQSLIEKIQSNQRKWKILEDDSEDEFGNIKVVDDDE